MENCRCSILRTRRSLPFVLDHDNDVCWSATLQHQGLGLVLFEPLACCCCKLLARGPARVLLALAYTVPLSPVVGALAPCTPVRRFFQESGSAAGTSNLKLSTVLPSLRLRGTEMCVQPAKRSTCAFSPFEAFPTVLPSGK